MEFINLVLNNSTKLINGELFSNISFTFHHLSVVFIVFSFLLSSITKYLYRFDIEGLVLFIDSSLMFLISAFINFNIYQYIINHSSLIIKKDLILTLSIISTLILMEIFYEISLKMINYTIYYSKYLFFLFSKKPEHIIKRG
ncbi:MAG: hypothetical protein ACOCV1_05420 [Bacillota bacterium]